jgi:hypothetical protein
MNLVKETLAARMLFQIPVQAIQFELRQGVGGFGGEHGRSSRFPGLRIRSAQPEAAYPPCAALRVALTVRTMASSRV